MPEALFVIAGDENACIPEDVNALFDIFEVFFVMGAAPGQRVLQLPSLGDRRKWEEWELTGRLFGL
jgi:hypothetical protein